MRHQITLCVRNLCVLFAAAALFLNVGCSIADAAAVNLPDPAVDAPLAAKKGEEVAIVAGGCFWGVEAVYEHVKGVTDVRSGYSGGTPKTAKYDLVSDGTTNHAESVQIKFDPSQISYGQILKIFFSVAHDPTQVNRQGPDVGTQYRSAIFCAGAEQKKIADAYIAQLDQAKVFSKRIATKVHAEPSFFEAEPYHQNYAALHPNEPYIVIHDLPKVAALRDRFPTLYREK